MTHRNWKQYFAENFQQACAPLTDTATRHAIGHSISQATGNVTRYAWTAITTTPGIAPSRYLRKLKVQCEMEVTSMTIVLQRNLRARSGCGN